MTKTTITCDVCGKGQPAKPSLTAIVLDHLGWFTVSRDQPGHRRDICSAVCLKKFAAGLKK